MNLVRSGSQTFFLLVLRRREPAPEAERPRHGARGTAHRTGHGMPLRRAPRPQPPRQHRSSGGLVESDPAG